jgi:undecaprenyl-diphosphatase
VNDWLAAALLGVVEGITEFLPISSTGHLLLVQHLGLVPAHSDVFNVVIQSGAVLAVIAAFRERSLLLVREHRDPVQRDYLYKLALAFAVTAVGGALMKMLDFELPETATPVAMATLIGGVLILLAEWGLRGRAVSEHIGWSVALAVGAAQVVAALAPGTSRSGACMVFAMLLGIERRAATEFSFLVGVPTLLAAAGLELGSAWLGGELASEPLGPLLFGTLVAGLSAFVVVKWLLRFVSSHTLNVFGVYRILLAALIFGTLGLAAAPGL